MANADTHTIGWGAAPAGRFRALRTMLLALVRGPGGDADEADADRLLWRLVDLVQVQESDEELASRDTLMRQVGRFLVRYDPPRSVALWRALYVTLSQEDSEPGFAHGVYRDLDELRFLYAHPNDPDPEGWRWAARNDGVLTPEADDPLAPPTA